MALSNATLAVLLATLDASITIIAMPDIFRGIHLDPLVPANSFYLLWMILGYLVVTSVLIVSLGRLGDMVGRVKIYNLGFVIYTVASLLLAIDWMQGRAGATYLIVFRIVQGIGGACLLANAAAIITDAFPARQRGMALGINNIVGVSGMFIGLVLGGILAPIDWRLVFLISVPGRDLRHRLGLPRPARAEHAAPRARRLGRQRHLRPRARPDHDRGHLRHPPGGRPSDRVGQPARARPCSRGAVVSLVAFVIVERRAADPMFRLPLFRIRAFTFGTLSTFLSAVARGGLMFMLIIWLQGIWLPQHGYDFTETPLWAGIYMLPLTIGMLCAGPTSGYLSDRFGARPFATGGMVLTAVGFAPADAAADRLLLSGVRRHPAAHRRGDGHVRLAQPRGGDEQPAAGRPRRRRGDEPDLPELRPGPVDRHLLHADDHRAGLDAARDDERRPAGARRRPATAHHVATLPPVSILFAAFLGYNPIEHLLGPHVLAGLSAHDQAVLTGQLVLPQAHLRAVPGRAARRVPVRDRRASLFAAFLGYNPIEHLLGPARARRAVGARPGGAHRAARSSPHLISGPFRDGLHAAFLFAIVACLIAAGASLLRGGRMVHDELPEPAAAPIPRRLRTADLEEQHAG